MYLCAFLSSSLYSAVMLSECFSSHPILKKKQKKIGLFSPLIFLCVSVLDPSSPLWLFKELPILALRCTPTHTHAHTHRFDTLEAAPGGSNKADKVNRTCGEMEGGGADGAGMEYGGYRNAMLAFCLEYDVDSDSNNTLQLFRCCDVSKLVHLIHHRWQFPGKSAKSSFCAFFPVLLHLQLSFRVITFKNVSAQSGSCNEKNVHMLCNTNKSKTGLWVSGFFYSFEFSTWLHEILICLFHYKRSLPHQVMTILSFKVYTWASDIAVGSFIGRLIVATHPVAQGSIRKVEGFRWSFLSGINLPSYLTCFHLKTDTSVISNYCDQAVCFVWIEWKPAGLWQVYLCCNLLKSSWKCVTFSGNIITASGLLWY